MNMDTNSAVAWAQACLTRLPLRHSTMGVPKAQLGQEKAGIVAAELYITPIGYPGECAHLGFSYPLSLC